MILKIAIIELFGESRHPFGIHVCRENQYLLEYGWSKLEPLAHYRFTDLDVDDYQKIIDSNGTSYGKQQQIRKVISALCSYGVKYRLLDFNLSTFLILDAPKGTPKNIF